MSSLFQLRRDHDIIVVETENDFFRRLSKIYDPQPLMQAQGDHHQDIDLQLVTAIDNLLVPHLGQWEQSEKWFHNIDCYGDGIRSLTFRRDVFLHHFVADLRALLSGEFELFCIVCGLRENLLHSDAVGPEKSPNDLIAITFRKFLITRGLAIKFSMI
jgi:hypothetical protein